MKLAIVMALLRHTLTTLGGVWVTKGYLSGDELNQGIGAIGVLVGVGLSVFHKWQVDKAKAKQPLVSQSVLPLLAVMGLMGGMGAMAQTNVVPVVTNPPPAINWPAIESVVKFLGQGSNWMVAPYGIYSSNNKYGGGVAALYSVTPVLATGMRLDYLDGTVWMPSGQIQLQTPVELFGKITVTPFTFAGLAIPLAGKGSENGAAVGIFGAGLAAGVSKNIAIAADWEKWTGAGFDSTYQIRAGVVIKF